MCRFFFLQFFNFIILISSINLVVIYGTTLISQMSGIVKTNVFYQSKLNALYWFAQAKTYNSYKAQYYSAQLLTYKLLNWKEKKKKKLLEAFGSENTHGHSFYLCMHFDWFRRVSSRPPPKYTKCVVCVVCQICQRKPEHRIDCWAFSTLETLERQNMPTLIASIINIVSLISGAPLVFFLLGETKYLLQVDLSAQQ